MNQLYVIDTKTIISLRNQYDHNGSTVAVEFAIKSFTEVQCKFYMSKPQFIELVACKSFLVSPINQKKGFSVFMIAYKI